MKPLAKGFAKNMNAVAVDTNVVMRFLVRDDEKQWQTVCHLFQRIEQEGRSIFVSNPVVLEIFWVLEKNYAHTRGKILDTLQMLFETPIIEWESETLVDRFLELARRDKVDLSDLLIALVAEEHGSAKCLTFDKAAAKLPYFEMITT